jgi:hypothetical protein
VTTQDVAHGRVLHPLKTFLGIHLSVPSSSDEAVALKASTGHQNEDPESRVTEAKTLRKRFAMGTDQGVDLVDISIIDFAELRGELDVPSCQFFEGLRDRHAEHAPERSVAGDRTLTVSQYVNSAHIPDLAVRSLETLHECGVVVVGDCAWVVDAEGIEGVCKGGTSFDRIKRLGEDYIFSGNCVDVPATDSAKQGNIV